MNDNVIKLNQKDVLDTLDEITKQNRSKTVKDNEYGIIQTSNAEKRDKPIYATIEYDELGNIIYEDYSKLIEILEEKIIPNNIKDTHIKNPKTNQKMTAKTIQGNVITKLRLSEKEQQFAIEYLFKKNIIVRGIDSSLDSEFEGYQFVSTYKTMDITETFTTEKNFEAFAKYQKFKEEIKKIPDNNPKKQQMTEQLQQIRNKIVEGNIPLIKYILRKKMPKWINPVDYEDIEQIAYEILFNYIDNYKSEEGYAFCSYIGNTLIRTILREYEKYQDFPMKEVMRTSLPKVLNMQIHLEMINGRKPTTKEIAEKTELSEEIVEICLLAITVKDTQSYEQYYEEKEIIANENNDEELYDEINYYHTEKSAENIYLDNEFKQTVKFLLENRLTDKEAKVLKYRFGFEGEEIKSYKEIAKMFNVTPEKIKMIEHKAIRKLRHPKNYTMIYNMRDLNEDNMSRPIKKG